MNVYGLKCFGINERFGNKAFVIEKDNFSTKERLMFAKKQDSTCIFMEEINDDFIKLDYYYPHAQSPLCLHGTLAAGYSYFKKNTNKTNVTAVTINQQHIEIEKIGNDIFLAVTQQASPRLEISPSLIQQLLNVDNGSLIVQSNIVSIGSPKLLIEINEKSILDFLSPNLKMIHAWSAESKVSGCYTYFKEDNLNLYGRNFNHLDSRFEDSATGVAAGALSCFFKSDINVYQGYNLGNLCVINTRYSDGKILIGGNVSEFYD